jgi:hypothetical protein
MMDNGNMAVNHVDLSAKYDTTVSLATSFGPQNALASVSRVNTCGTKTPT